MGGNNERLFASDDEQENTTAVENEAASLDRAMDRLQDTIPDPSDAPVAMPARSLMRSPVDAALGLFSSAIKAGEPWSSTCEGAYADARTHLDLMHRALENAYVVIYRAKRGRAFNLLPNTDNLAIGSLGEIEALIGAEHAEKLRYAVEHSER